MYPNFLIIITRPTNLERHLFLIKSFCCVGGYGRFPNLQMVHSIIVALRSLAVEDKVCKELGTRSLELKVNLVDYFKIVELTYSL